MDAWGTWGTGKAAARYSERKLRREHRAARIAFWATVARRIWRWRWQLYPVAVATLTGMAAWATSVAYALGHHSAPLIVAAIYAATAVTLGTVGPLRRPRDRIYLTAVAAYLIAHLHAVTHVWLPFIDSPWRLLGALALLSLFGWLPVAVPYWWHFRVRERLGIQRQRDAWARHAELLNIPGSKLRWHGITPLHRDGVLIGRQLRVRGRPGQTAADVATGDKGRSVFDVPAGGSVTAEEAGAKDEDDTTSTARDIIITIITRSPWRKRTSTAEHPLLSVLDELERYRAALEAGADGPELSAAAAQWAPAARTVHIPIPVAVSATGAPFALPLWDPQHGAHSYLIGGPKGAGKGVLINNVLVGLAACADSYTILIDVSEKQGKDGRRWGAAIDQLCTTYRHTIAVLEDVLAEVKARAGHSAIHGQHHLHIPTPDDPLITVIVDEAKSAMNNPREAKACQYIAYLLAEIARLGRSEAVSVIVCTQRPEAMDLGGSGALKANLDGRIQLPVNSRADAQFVLEQDFTKVNVPEARSCPAGTFVCVDYRGVHEAQQRTYTLVQYPLITRLGKLYAGHRPGLPQIGLHRPAAPQPAPTPERTTAVTDVFADMAVPAAPDLNPTERTINETRSRLGALRQDYAAQTAAGPVGIDVPGQQMTAGHVNDPAPVEPGDEKIRAVLLATIRNAIDQGRAGAPRSELVDAVRAHNLDRPEHQRLPDSPATILRALQQLKDDQLAQGVGAGRGAYWTLPLTEAVV